jgi:hypothetical protein
MEKVLRNGTGENQPIANALKIISPLYRSNYMKTSLVKLLQTKPIIFIGAADQVELLIKEVPADVCKNFQVSNFNDIGPFWMAVVLHNKSVWFEDLNQLVTQRMIRRPERTPL